MTVAIIDDAAIVREGLKKIIQTNCPQYEIVGEAADGEKGLVLINQVRPDVCIVDMKMPKMSGIEMVAKVRENNNHTQFIVLSAYSDFSYAKAMISYGCTAYLLKPVDHQELVTLLNSLDKPKAVRTYTMNAKHHTVQHLLDGTLEQAGSIPPQIERIIAGQYAVAVVMIDNKATTNGEQTTVLINHITTVLDSEHVFVHIREDGSLVLLLPFTNEEEVGESLDLIKTSTMKKLGDSLTIGVQIHNPISSLTDTYAEACHALDASFHLPWGCIQWYQGEFAPVDHGPFFILEGQIFLSLSMEDHNEAAQQLRAVTDRLQRQQISKQQCLLIIERQYTMLMKTLMRQNNDELIQRLPATESFIKALTRKQRMVQIVEQVDQVAQILERFSQETSKMDVTKRATLRKVLRYIGHNLDQELSLSDVAKVAHMTPSYFSLYFKKEMEETYISFLTRVKVEKAKELLLNPEIKIYELSTMLGFKDSKYFSRKFKHITGMTPREYRDSTTGVYGPENPNTLK
jgi:two-component system response regulator YesN